MTVYTTIDYPSGVDTTASGINDGGQIVGSSSGHGFLLSGGQFTTFDFGALGTQAFGINDLAQIVGSYQSIVPASFPFVGTYGFIVGANVPALYGDVLTGITNSGLICGYSGANNAAFGFLSSLSDTAHTTPINDPLATPNGLGAGTTHVFGINNAGQLVGNYLAGPFNAMVSHGFIYSGGTYTTIDDPLGAGGTYATGINDAGQIAGYFIDANAAIHGFIDTGGVFTTFDDPAGGGTRVFGINDVGQIVGDYFDVSGHRHGFVGTLPAPPPFPGTSANMVLRRGDGTYQIYNIGNNAISASYPLIPTGQVGPDWGFVTLGGFNDGDTSDMLLRNSTSGGFQVYDISNNNIYASFSLGNVGLNWQASGFGNFSSLGENDMILRDTGTGGMQVYDIRNNQITGSAFMGTVGLNWQMAGVSNHGTQSDLVLRDSGSGGLEIYNIANNAITGASLLGSVGLDWQPSGFGDFSSRNEGDMLLRNVNTGGLELYDIANNAITGAFFLGNVGLDWQYAGIAPIEGPGTSDLVLRNVNTGAFQVYNIANNQLTGSASLGAVGLDWQLGGFAADPPTGAVGSSDNATAQLVQAMAGFGGGSGAADGLNAGFANADASQQPFLTAPQHA